MTPCKGHGDGGPVKYRKDKRTSFTAWSDAEKKTYPKWVSPLVQVATSSSPEDDPGNRSITAIDDFFIAMRYVENCVRDRRVRSHDAG